MWDQIVWLLWSRRFRLVLGCASLLGRVRVGICRIFRSWWEGVPVSTMSATVGTSRPVRLAGVESCGSPPLGPREDQLSRGQSAAVAVSVILAVMGWLWFSPGHSGTSAAHRSRSNLADPAHLGPV